MLHEVSPLPTARVHDDMIRRILSSNQTTVDVFRLLRRQLFNKPVKSGTTKLWLHKHSIVFLMQQRVENISRFSGNWNVF